MSTVGEAVAADRGRAGGSGLRVVGERAVGGGCIHQARIVELSDASRWFVKSNRSAPAGMFEAEARGLECLGAVGALRVPSGAWVGRAGGESYLAMEAIAEGRPDADFAARFGRGLANLHRDGRGRRFGFEGDNYLGSTPQPNPWADDWVTFFRDHRLGFQLRLARDRGRTDRTLERLGDRLLDRLGDWLDLPEEPPCLLHGDLWSGNFLVDSEGEPVLVDPAVYYGHREAELAMTRLFGGFEPGFYAAYEASWPLPAGTGERDGIYRLYHLLNHLNLFGGAYRAGCIAILQRLVG